MPNLNLSLVMATQALQAENGAVSATTNNIANANTPGYARERVVLSEAPPSVEGAISFGNGVVLKGFESVRDQLIELRIGEETQQQSRADAEVNALQQIESHFSDETQGIGASLSAFFNNLQQLSTDPTSVASRQSVLVAANSLADSFHQTMGQIDQIRSSLDNSVGQSISQINDISEQIAKLNLQVSQMKNLGQNPGSVEDQRVELVHQLAGLIGVSDIQSDDGDTLTTANGVPLVVGANSYQLEAAPDGSGMQHVFARGKDITSFLDAGQIGGALHVRDQFIPDMVAKLNSLASDITTAFNGVHNQGFDLSGTQGGDFFGTTPGASAASGITVLISDPQRIAASTDGSAGSNGNVISLLKLQQQPLSSGQNASDVYANIVFQAGSASAHASAELSASKIMLQQLETQRAAVSGVSIDEETANLMQYQRAFQAAARVISTIDTLMSTVIGMGAQ